MAVVPVLVHVPVAPAPVRVEGDSIDWSQRLLTLKIKQSTNVWVPKQDFDLKGKEKANDVPEF